MKRVLFTTPYYWRQGSKANYYPQAWNPPARFFLREYEVTATVFPNKVKLLFIGK
jgi:hypothetical protein